MKYLVGVLILFLTVSIAACGGSGGGGTTSKNAQAQAMSMGLGKAIGDAVTNGFEHITAPAWPTGSIGGVFGGYKAHTDCFPSFPVGCIYVVDVDETPFGDGTGVVSGTLRLILSYSDGDTQTWDVIPSDGEGTITVVLTAFPFNATVGTTQYD